MSYVLQFFIAAIATVTFAILFAAPKKELVFCGVSGGLAWLVYFILYRQSGNVVLGSLVATFVLTILSRILAGYCCHFSITRIPPQMQSLPNLHIFPYPMHICPFKILSFSL